MVKIKFTDKTLDRIKQGYDDVEDFISKYGEYLDPKDATKYNPDKVNITRNKQFKEKFVDDIYDVEKDTFNFSALTGQNRPVINEGIKQMVESGQLKTANDISQDQLQLLSLRRDKQDKIRNVRKNRKEQGNVQAAIDAINSLRVNKEGNLEKITIGPAGTKTTQKPLPDGRREIIVDIDSDVNVQKLKASAKKGRELNEIPLGDGSTVPNTKMIDPRNGEIVTYSSVKNGPSLQVLADNFIQFKGGSGLLTETNIQTPAARAQFEVMSHTMRGLALRDPLAVQKLLAKDPEIMGVLEKARDDFSFGMRELIEQKEELLANPELNKQITEIARKFYPNAGDKFVNAAKLDLAHIFPFTETARVNPGSSFLTEGGNPKYLYLAPSGVNRKIQVYLEARIREAAKNVDEGVKLEMSERNLMKADELLKKLKSLSIVPLDTKRNIISGDMSLRTDDAIKLTTDDYKDLFSYILDMKNIEQEVMSGVVPRLQDGGAVGGPIPMEDEEEGILDYIKDKAASIDEGLQTYIDEELGGNPNRAVPVAIGEMLKAPGKVADKLREGMDEVNANIDKAQDMLELERLEALGGGDEEKFNQIMRQQEMLDQSRRTDFDKYVNLATPLDIFDMFFGEDLGNAYNKMFTDEDDTTLYLDPTGLFSDKSYTIEGDSTFGKVIGAARTLGLTAAEVALLFTPYQLLKLRKLDSSKLKKILAGAVNIGVPAAGFTYGYASLPRNFQEAQEGLKQSEEGATRSLEEIQKEVTKGDQADPINPGGSGLDYADGGMVGLPSEFTGEYAETKLALGGEPGQFSNPTPSGLEEEIDIGDYLLDAPYESVEDLDNLFDITRSAEDAFQRGTGEVDDFPEVQVASLGKIGEGVKYVLGEVPNWVRQGKDRIQKILPKTGDDLEQSLITTLDEGTVTRTQPGQLFYSRLEAELMQGPKVYDSLDAFKKYTQSRNIGKVELFDSELERIIESAQASGRPITRELVLGALKESPLSKVQSSGYGFLSNTLDGKQRGLKYSGYKEGGAIPNTDRERLLFVDPKDLRGDPGSLPSSMSPHSWEEPYTIAWSRLSDRDLGGAYTGKTVTFADEIQSDIFQSAQKTAGKLAAKIKYMADNNVPLDTINNELQRDMMTFFADKGSVYRESLPGAAELQVEMKALMDLQDQLTALKNTPVPEITDDMLDAAKNIRYQQNDIIDNMTEELNLQLVKTLYPNLPFKLRGQWADASIKRDIYEAAYRKFVLKDPDATDYYAVTPANLVTKRYSHSGSSATSQADRAADKAARIKRWVDGGMEGDVPNSQYPGIGMYEFYGGPGADVVTDTGKHYTSEIEKIMKRIAKENQVSLETLPVRISEGKREVFQVVDRNTGEVLGSGNTGRQADAIANDIIANSDRKVSVQRAEEFDTAPSFGIELTPSMAEAFKAYMAKGGLVEEEILLPYGD